VFVGKQTQRWSNSFFIFSGFQVVESLRNQLREATDKLQACLNKADEQESLLKSSDDVKTAKIVHLEDACQRSNKELQEFREMCGVLTSETKRLQDDLSAAKDGLEKTAQELLAWKEKAENLETKVVEASLQKVNKFSECSFM
jgi:predicted nuclease with TOPRIM domain